ncbi:putative O-antigen polymerase [Desulfobacula toluolica Tol2]|uniref:Putative O-antigen polymerase n=2 Tax=Desulfobacula toluolica TaxID=28223 RepID=K0NJF2_DESTT|nr:putative O-antigen polymerase [Desulfobacula toluolica Tol2]
MCILSFIFSTHKPFALEGLFMLLTYIAAYFITLSSIQTRKQQRILVYVIISTAILISIIAILKQLDINPFPWWDYPGYNNSFAGPYVNRNHMAGFLDMAIPMLTVLFITRQRSLEITTGMILVIIFLLTSQAFTLSRGGWVSTITAILFIAGVLLAQKDYVHKKVILTIGISVTIISLFILSSLPVVQRITTLTQQDPVDTLSSRIRCWQGAIDQIKENLMIGTGPDSFAVEYPAYQLPGYAVLFRYAHNDYLHFISETGILLIPIMIFTLFCFFRSGFQKLTSHSRQKRGFALGAMAGVFAILIHSFSDFNLNIPANALLFSILAGIAVQDSMKSHNKPISQA